MAIFNISKKILFIIFVLIFALNLACSKTSIEEDIEETYISESYLISSAMANSLEKIGQASLDYADNIPKHKAIVKEHIEEVKACYDMYLELKPPKRLEKANDLYGKAMDHLLNSTTFLQSYIDTDDIEEMIRYLRQSKAEMGLAVEYMFKAVEEKNKLTE